MSSKAWTEDWDAFIDYLQKSLREGRSNEELNESLSGQVVHWRGLLEEKHLDSQAPAVTISMPARALQIDAEHTAVLDGFSLPVADEALRLWSEAMEGREVDFTANFLDKTCLFPAIDVKVFRSGRTTILLGLQKGSLR